MTRVDVALSLTVGLVLIVAIIAANGYFVAQEFAYMTVDRSRLKAMAAQGDASGKRMLRITDRTSFMLSGAQLGITVTGLLVGNVAEPLVGSAVGSILGGVGVPTAVGVTIGTVGVLVGATFVQMLFGELYPKNLAIARPLRVASALAASTWLYMRLFGWLIRLFDASANALLRVLRVEPVHDVEHSANLQDLRRIVTVSRAAGELPPELSLVLDRMIDFPHQRVLHALVPRSRIDVVGLSQPLDEVLEVMQGGHSRYPVLDEEGDVRGVVHLGDVLHAARRGSTPLAQLSVDDVARPATVVPTSMRLPDVLEAMTEHGDQMACVIDEHGGFVGLVTAEDLVEEISGELTDEHDALVEPHLEPDGERRWLAQGGAPLDEVSREIGLSLPDGDFQTVAGLAIDAAGRLLEVGERVHVEIPPEPVELAHDADAAPRLLHLEIVEVGRRVPARLRLELAGPEVRS